MTIEELLDNLDLPAFNCRYVDVRIEKTQSTLISYRNYGFESGQESPSLGAFVRVYNHGKWFFAATTELDEIKTTILELIDQSRLFADGDNPERPARAIEAFRARIYESEAATRHTLDEKRVFLERFIPVLQEFTEITNPILAYQDKYKVKYFKASDGMTFSYDYNQAGVVARYTLKNNDQVFDDSHREFFQNIDGQFESCATGFRDAIEEGLLFLGAEAVTPGNYRVLLSPEVAGVFTHESFGHKSEADFMLGDETMKKEWEMGKQVGSELLSIVDDGNSPGTTGYCPIDDEGNLKQKTYLVKQGRLAGRLHSSDTALALEEANTGNARAINFEFEPIVRMTNTYIEKGDKTFDELVAAVGNGVYIKDFQHGMGMSTFTIAPRKSYLIENGKLTRPVRVSVISGNVFETLNLIEALGSDYEIHSSAFGGCGKMEQSPLPVADGGPSVLVSRMNVS
jgi:predicted Zn-dependent protease